MGLLFSINSLLAFSRYSSLTLASNLVFILIIFVIFYTTKRYRDKECNGFITFSKSHSYIVYSFFFGSLISTIVKYMYFMYIDPTLLSEVIFNQSLQNFQKIGKTLSDEELKLFKDFVNNPLSFCIQFMWINLFLGAILGLILSFFIKRKETNNSGQIENIEA
jgi:Protein of unknown function (DUF4199)